GCVVAHDAPSPTLARQPRAPEKTAFPRSSPVVLTFFMDGLPQVGVLDTQLWHIDAVRAPSTPSPAGSTPQGPCFSPLVFSERRDGLPGRAGDDVWRNGKGKESP